MSFHRVSDILGYPEILRYSSPTSTFTINFLHDLLSRYGITDPIVSDVIPFSAKVFECFCKAFAI